MKNILLAGMIGIWTTSSLAHSPLKSTTPANEVVIAMAPAEVLFDFTGEIRLTRVTMTIENHPSVDLDLDGHSGFITEYAVPLPRFGSGPYQIDWRGLGADGHALNGTFAFTVQ